MENKPESPEILKLSQNRFGNRHFYSFHENYCHFAYRDKADEGEMYLNYIDLPDETTTIEDNAPGPHTLLGIVAGLTALVLVNMGWVVTSSILLITTAICILKFKPFATGYTVFDTTLGNICVIQDKLHDQVVDELWKRKEMQRAAAEQKRRLKNTMVDEILRHDFLGSPTPPQRALFDESLTESQKAFLRTGSYDRPQQEPTPS